MRCFKLLGERVMVRDFDRQVAELSPSEFADQLVIASVPREVTLHCLYELKLVVQGLIAN